MPVPKQDRRLTDQSHTCCATYRSSVIDYLSLDFEGLSTRSSSFLSQLGRAFRIVFRFMTSSATTTSDVSNGSWNLNIA